MSKSNVEIVSEYIDGVFNHKQFDQASKYCDPNCVIHNPPYVGLGIGTDNRSNERLIIIEIAPNSPAAGHLLPGDELVRVTDGDKTWETYKDFLYGAFAQGIVGTPLTITVRRQGQLVDIPIKRGRVEGFDMNVSKYIDIWRNVIATEWMEFNEDIKLIFGADDLVTVYIINSGTHREFHQSAVWSECDIYRLREGKITDIWAVEDSLTELTQLGYQVRQPVKEMA